MIEINATTLKRLENYAAVVENRCREAEQLQWRVMTFEVMQAAELARSRFREVGSIAAYATYLHQLQSGRDHQRAVYGEPLLSRGLVSLLQELSIKPKILDLVSGQSSMAAE